MGDVKINLISERFGRLLVVREGNRRGYKRYWVCMCDCGNETEVYQNSLKNGDTKSCGCYNKDKASARRTTHGMSTSKIYRVWAGMIKRCTNPNDSHYIDYGGRGIKVCDRWLDSFENFYEDMGERPEGFTLDRVNNDKNYSPENCRWVTKEEQVRNQRKKKNNTSGATGVFYCKRNDGYQAGWIEDGKLRLKYFSCNKYGSNVAFNLAKEYRENKIKELNKLGYGYTEKHGK